MVCISKVGHASRYMHLTVFSSPVTVNIPAAKSTRVLNRRTEKGGGRRDSREIPAEPVGKRRGVAKAERRKKGIHERENEFIQRRLSPGSIDRDLR